MMHILDQIVAYKKEEVSKFKAERNIAHLEKSEFFQGEKKSLAGFIKNLNRSGVIAEFKRKSPSKQDINLEAKLEPIVKGYEEANASAISILTDNKFFGGQNDFLGKAKDLVNIPLLRKEFIIDEYQIIEAKSIGADAVLLIARILTNQELTQFSTVANNLGLEVLIEIHNKEELDKLPSSLDVIGINNRDLSTFQVDYQNSIDLLNQLPQGLCKISESGIHNVETMIELYQAGFDGFLIGERFMANADPGRACKEMIDEFLNKRKDYVD